MTAVAIIADAHFHDITADYDAPGVMVQGRRLTLRSWHDTALAARVFNESGMALDAALAEVRQRGIRHVVLLGDYTDDGQVETTRHLAARLHAQTDLAFYVLPGNHDVWGPHGKHTATRYLSPTGPQLVTSDPALAAWSPPDTILTPKLYCAGQPQGLIPMAAFGLTRQPHYLHWESPFGASDAFPDRMYDARSADGHTTRRLMDASYLVEPEAGLWLLMIDANVFEPRDGDWREDQKRAFIDPAAQGWNAVLRVKPFLLPWIARVTARARTLGKALLTLSHYPVLDPFDDRDGLERALFGESETFRRTPGPQVALALAAAGVTTHFSGHIHANATTSRDTPEGRITNIAIPALVAWPPAFAIAHASPAGPQTETVSLARLPLDPILMAVYRNEPGAPEMLAAPDYGTFLLAQIRRRALHRDLPRDWPASIAAAVSRTARNLAALMQGASSLTAAAPAGPEAEALAFYPLTDLIADLYVLKQAGALAREALSPERLALLRQLAARFGSPNPATPNPDAAFFARILAVLQTSLARMDAG